MGERTRAHVNKWKYNLGIIFLTTITKETGHSFSRCEIPL